MVFPSQYRDRNIKRVWLNLQQTCVTSNNKNKKPRWTPQRDHFMASSFHQLYYGLDKTNLKFVLSFNVEIQYIYIYTQTHTQTLRGTSSTPVVFIIPTSSRRLYFFSRDARSASRGSYTMEEKVEKESEKVRW